MNAVRLLPLALGLAVALAVGVMLAVGSFFPEAHVVAREIALDAAPESVWELVADRGRYPDWVPGLEEVRRLDDADGRELWLQRGRGGELTVAIEGVEQGRAFVTRVVGDDVSFGGTWSCEVAGHGVGSRLSVTERGVIPGRLARFWAHVVFGPEHAVDAWLLAVARALGEDARPGPAGGLAGGEA